jgi:hypothetical protein
MPYNFPHTAYQTYNLKTGNSRKSRLLLNRSLFFRRSLDLRSFTRSSGSSSGSALQHQKVKVLSPILLLLFAFSGEALTSRTTQTIHGSAPYLTFDGGVTKATDVNDLLWVALPDGTKITPNTNPSSPSNPISLPNVGDDFTNIDMLVPVGSDTVSLNTLIGPPNNYWKDDDGDGDVTATGDLTLTITDKDSNPVTRSEVLDICKSPYKVKLASTAGTLSTSYGVPHSSTFAAGDVEYYLKPNSPAKVCFARPGSLYQYYSAASPLNIWNPDNGFLVQSTVTSGYHRNFPTTGTHNLYFDLDLRHRWRRCTIIILA